MLVGVCGCSLITGASWDAIGFWDGGGVDMGLLFGGWDSGYVRDANVGMPYEDAKSGG